MELGTDELYKQDRRAMSYRRGARAVVSPNGLGGDGSMNIK